MNTDTWSRIGRTELAGEVYASEITSDPRRCYHNLRHIDSMYDYLQETGVPYDVNLDWAVLFHDIVYDEKPSKEKRSAQAFYDMIETYRGFEGNLNDALEVGVLIMSTITHELHTFSTRSQKAIIRADLHELADPVKATRNFVNIMDESMSLYGVSQEEFAQSNATFMVAMRDRIRTNKHYDAENAEFYEQVLGGIELTIRLARAVGG